MGLIDDHLGPLQARITPAAVGYYIEVTHEGMEELQPPWRLTYAGALRCSHRRLAAQRRADARRQRVEIIEEL